MSHQIEDEFIYDSNKYILSDIEFPENFIDIYSLGFKPTEFNTACWRGFIATYSVYKKYLVLKNLYTNNGSNLKNVAPKLNNKLPKISINKDWVSEETKMNRREFTYTNINLNIPYTGSIIIVKDFIDKYISGPYAFLNISPCCYKKIIRLTFIDGILANTKNLSNYCKKIRTEKINTLKDERHDSAYFGWPDINNLFKEEV